MALTIAELQVALRPNTAALDAAIKGAPAKGRAAGEAIAAGVAQGMASAGPRIQQAGHSITSVGQSMAAGITRPLMGIGAQALKSASDFEQVKSVFASTAQATSSQMQQVSALSIKLGADVKLPGVSATQAMAAMLELSKAGLSVTTSMQAARGALALAGTEGIKHAKAAEITANALNMFNLKGKDATMVANLLAGAAAASSGGVIDMAYSLRNGGAAFAGMKIPLDQFMTSVGLLAKNGIMGSMAGTQLRQMMIRLAAPTATAAIDMHRLGINIHDAHGKMLPYRDIIANLQRSFAGLSDAEKTHAMNSIFGKFAMQAATVVIKEGVTGFDAMNAAIKRKDAALVMAAARMAGFKGATEQFSSALETAYIVVATRFLPALTNVINQVSAAVTRFSTLSPATQNLAIGFLAIVAAAGPVLIVIGNLVTAIGAIMTVAAPVAAFLTGPLGLAILAVGAAVAGMAVAWRTNFGGIQGIVRGFVAAVGPMLAPLVVEIRKIAAVVLPFLRDAFQTYLPTIRAIWTGTWNVVAGTVRTVLAVVTGVVTAALRLLQGDWRGALDALKSGAVAAWAGIRQIFTGFGQWIKGWGTGVIATIKAMGGQLLDGLINGVKAGAGKARDAVVGVAHGIVQGFKTALGISSPSRVFATLGQDAMQGLVMGLMTGQTSVRDAAARLIKPMQDGIDNANRRLREQIAETRATMRDLRSGGDFERFANKNAGADPAAIRTAFNELQTMEALREKMDSQAQAAKDLKRELADLNLESLKLAATTKEEQVAIERFRMPLSELTKDAQKAVTEFVRLRAEMQRMETLKKLKQSLPNIGSVMSQGGEYLSSEGAKVSERVRYGHGLLKTIPDIGGAMSQGGQEYAAASKGVKPIDQSAQRAKLAIRDMGAQFIGIFAGALDRAKGGVGGFFNSLLGGIKNTITQMLMEMAKQKILSQVFGSKNAGGGGQGGDLLGAGLSFLPGGGLIGGALKKLFRFADGGVPPVGVPSIVGERGPELFVPDRPGRIVPNHEMGKAGGPSNVTVNWNQNGPINNEADERRLTEHIVNRTQDAVRMAFV